MSNNLYIEFINFKNVDNNKENFGYFCFNDGYQDFISYSENRKECDFTLKEFLGDIISNNDESLLDIIEENLEYKKGITFREKYFSFDEVYSLYYELKETYEELEEIQSENDGDI